MASRPIRKTISLPPELARELQEQARSENKTLSVVIQEALSTAKRVRLKSDFKKAQAYWTEKAVEKGILSEKDLERYLRR
jgi:predicted transcriptional regulator